MKWENILKRKRRPDDGSGSSSEWEDVSEQIPDAEGTVSRIDDILARAKKSVESANDREAQRQRQRERNNRGGCWC